MKIIWTLFYDRQVTAYLRMLSGTKTGQTIHEAIIAIQGKKDPSEGLTADTGWADRYHFDVANHRVTIEIRADRKAVGVILLEAI